MCGKSVWLSSRCTFPIACFAEFLSFVFRQMTDCTENVVPLEGGGDVNVKSLLLTIRKLAHYRDNTAEVTLFSVHWPSRKGEVHKDCTANWIRTVHWVIVVRFQFKPEWNLGVESSWYERPLSCSVHCASEKKLSLSTTEPLILFVSPLTSRHKTSELIKANLGKASDELHPMSMTHRRLGRLKLDRWPTLPLLHFPTCTTPSHAR